MPTVVPPAADRFSQRMVWRAATISVVLLAWCGPRSEAAAAEVKLADGRVISGDIVSADDQSIVVRQSTGGMTADLHFTPAEVAEIRPGDTAAVAARAALEQRRLTLVRDGDAAAWWQFSQDCRRAGDTIAARAAAQEVIAMDRSHEAARRFLGFVPHRGVWMRPNEVAVAEGRVWFDGRWVSWAERQEVEAQAEARRQAAVAARQAAADRYAARTASSDYTTPWVGYPATAITYGYADYAPRMVYWPAYGPGNGCTSAGYTAAGYNSSSSGGFGIGGGGLVAGGSSGSGSWGVRWHW